MTAATAARAAVKEESEPAKIDPSPGEGGRGSTGAWSQNPKQSPQGCSRDPDRTVACGAAGTGHTG